LRLAGQKARACAVREGFLAGDLPPLPIRLLSGSRDPLIEHRPLGNHGSEARAHLREGRSSSQRFSQVAQSLQVLAVGVVHVLRCPPQVGLEAEVAAATAGVEHLVQLHVNGIAHAIEDDVDQVRRPPGKSPVFRRIVTDRLTLVPFPRETTRISDSGWRSCASTQAQSAGLFAYMPPSMSAYVWPSAA
jgi:hypothetical protein